MLLCQVDVAWSLLDVLYVKRLILLVFHVVMSNDRGFVKKWRETPHALANATEMAELYAVLQTALKHTAKNMEDLLQSLKQKR